MKNIKKIIFTLNLILVIFSSSICFAGTWHKEPILTGYTYSFSTGDIKNVLGNPDISIRISADDSYRTIQVSLFELQYIPKPPSEGGGMKYVKIQDKSINLNPNEQGYLEMDTFREGIRVNGTIKYEVKVLFGGASKFSGYYSYFIDN